jgi:hypothetical protein
LASRNAAALSATPFADFRQCFDMIPMRVRDENVPELKLFGGDQLENRPGIQPVSNKRRLARDFIPDR